MKFNNKLRLAILLAVISLPAIANAQTTKPRLRRPPRIRSDARTQVGHGDGRLRFNWRPV